MKRRFLFAAALTLPLLTFVLIQSPPRATGFASDAAGFQAKPYQYPFQNPNLSAEDRITNLLSLMTLEEKVACLGTNPSVPRLGVRGAGQMEGLHGLAVGGPAKLGRDHPVTTTTFPQAYGLGETWDTDIIRRAAAAEGFEARYIFQSEKYGGGRTGLVIRAPNADLGRDPRWGRTEECSAKTRT